MLKKILIGIAVVILLVLIFIAIKPGAYTVSRSTNISAPPAVIYAQIADFHRWDAWSPWAKLDPGMKTTYSGPASGTGAGYAWAGNDKVGEGKMVITAAKPAERVDIKLDFIKPWEATNSVSFILAPAAGPTKVTWAMSGDNGFVARAFTLFSDMDSMIGKDFDQGLATMKTVAEAEAKRLAAEEAAKKAAADAAAAAAAAEAAAQAAAAAAKPTKGKGSKK